MEKETSGMILMKVSEVFVLLSVIILLAGAVSADIPSGSIEIRGLNGTVLTGSRNVFLNISYSSSDGIDICRFANDDYLDLASMSWEECTTVKAWLLSGDEGNKTVYFEVRDINGHAAIFNDSIMFRFIQDFTPPTAPIVYDGSSGEDIDWWNSNTSLGAFWFGSTEDISTIFYRYRILEGAACYAGDCNFTSTGTSTSVDVDLLSLIEGGNYSFEVIAYNHDGLNSSSGLSDDVTIDMTRPGLPEVDSSTHPDQITPYDSAIAIFNWTSSDPLGNGVASGVYSYSYLLDKHLGTAPDNVAEGRYWDTLAYMRRGSYNQTLKVNGTGMAYAVFSQVNSNFSVNDSLHVSVALAEQISDYSDLMGVKVYLTKVAQDLDIGSFDMESGAVTEVYNESWDVRYADSLTSAKAYQFSLTLNDTVDDNTEDVYVVVSGILSDDDNRNPLAIAGTATGELIDNSTKNFICPETGICIQNTSTLDYAIEVKRQDSGSDWSVRYDYLGDDTYYFHVKAQDLAGNWGDTAHYRILVAAGGVGSLIYSPVNGEVITGEGPDVNTTVRVVVSGNTTAYVVVIHPLGDNYTSPSHVMNLSHDFEDVQLKLGLNEIYAVTNTTSGAVAHSSSVFVIASSEPEAATNKTLRVRYNGCAATPLPYVCYLTEGDAYVGIATETEGALSGSDVQQDTSVRTIKIFMSRQFDLADVSARLATDDFLDRVNPAFGYKYGADVYSISNELRYKDIFLGGNFIVSPGTYQLYIMKSGTTSSGMSNITIAISD
ncbi:MAG: hypothetical protein ABIA62_03380 [Candidatus Woesearchaeota archaeon]